MMVSVRCAFIALALPVSVMAATLQGLVHDSAGQPLSGAEISVARQGRATSGADGRFVIEVPAGEHEVRIVRPGYRPEIIRLEAGMAADITLQPAFEEAIVVSGIRAGDETPVTTTDLARAEIEEKYHGQDIPLLLRETPSIHSYADSGVGGSGYSYLSLRGIAATRINFTLDGVPLADSEDFGTYFADFPDLARSLESIQVQRGVGTSTFGSPSFGGSVNLQSIDLAPLRDLDVTVGGGSFGNRQASVGYQSGTLPGGFALYSRLSFLESDGYRDHSGAEQRNLFFSAARQSESSQIRITGFTGHESQNLSYFAADEETLQQDPRANFNSPDDLDSFGYDLVNVQYLRSLGKDGGLSASAYYQRGYGSYRLSGVSLIPDERYRFGIDGQLLGAFVTANWRRGELTGSYGLHANRFVREHTRDDFLVDRPVGRAYFNEGTKREGNAFAKVGWTQGPLYLYSDLQLRYSDFAYDGDVQIESKSWAFFNPKIGVRWATSSQSSAWLSAGVSGREPTRNDLFLGEDNPTVRHDLDAVRPEQVTDIELGWERRTATTEVAANFFAMEFRNEIAATGEYSELGLAYRRNVDRSFRRGIELEGRWRPWPALRVEGDLSVSRNRIARWTQFFPVVSPSSAGTRAIDYRDVHPALTPSAVGSAAVTWSPSSRAGVGVGGRYVSETYLDNTDHEAFTTPSLFTVDLNTWWRVSSHARLSLQVNNVLDRRRLYASGYAARSIQQSPSGGETFEGTRYFYPQATRNFVVTLDIDL